MIEVSGHMPPQRPLHTAPPSFITPSFIVAWFSAVANATLVTEPNTMHPTHQQNSVDSRRSRSRRTQTASTFLTAVHFLCSLQLASSQKFDPYQLNGGLVAAVAGKDYVIIASDTRLTDGGYGINSRRYLNGRIWSASSPSLLMHDGGTSSAEDSTLRRSTPHATISSVSLTGTPARWEADGSLAMTRRSDDIGGKETAVITSSPTYSIPLHSVQQTNLPVMIGSAGCASDCESLKRRVRLELDSLECNFPSGKMGVQSVANLLQQVLYGRRGFPFYSFCVVAGIDRDEQTGDSKCGMGAVYVYDAIGSFERVAVGSAGTGRELLQPILDRMFSGSANRGSIKQNNNVIQDGLARDVMAVPAGRQRTGVAGSLRPPVETTVECTWEEAVNNVARAYQSVAEREISVGDEVVICVVKASGSTEDEDSTTEVFSFQLKKH